MHQPANFCKVMVRIPKHEPFAAWLVTVWSRSPVDSVNPSPAH